VIAGAGSGKTRVITCRWLASSTTGPTAPHPGGDFTNKAAREMKNAWHAAWPPGSDCRHVLGTFHGCQRGSCACMGAVGIRRIS